MTKLQFPEGDNKVFNNISPLKSITKKQIAYHVMLC